MEGKRKQILLATVIVIFTFAALTVAYYLKNCGVINEIKLYTGLRDNVYFSGTRVCPSSWSLKPIKKEEIKNLPKDKKAEIITLKDDSDIAKLLSENFLGYNKSIVGEDKNSFIIYEILCKPCEIK